MKLLLDTHIFLWSLLEPEHLDPNVSQQLDDPGNELWLSPISTWEVMILADRGRIDLNAPPDRWLQTVFSTVPFQQAPLTHNIAIRSREIQLPHQDPADRFLVATALIHDLTLVTADRIILESAACKLLPNN